MSALEVNKILASIILAIIVVVLISFLGDIMMNEENDELTKNSYHIEIEKLDKNDILASQGNTQISEPISMFLVNASPEKGKKIFKKCSACHNYEKNSANKVGPNLWNIINRPMASIQGFAYSKVLAEFGGNWGYEELNQFLYKPKEYMEGTKMNFSGLKKTDDRANLILFLREQSENPAALP